MMVTVQVTRRTGAEENVNTNNTLYPIVFERSYAAYGAQKSAVVYHHLQKRCGTSIQRGHKQTVKHAHFANRLVSFTDNVVKRRRHQVES